MPETEKVYEFGGVVKSVEERKEKIWVKGNGEKAEFRYESMGWWVHLEGWPVALHFGVGKPDCDVGDKMISTVRFVKP